MRVWLRVAGVCASCHAQVYRVMVDDVPQLMTASKCACGRGAIVDGPHLYAREGTQISMTPAEILDLFLEMPPLNRKFPL